MIMRASWNDQDSPRYSDRVNPSSRQQARDRLHRAALREYLAGEGGLVDAQVILEQALEHRAQIGGRLEVALLVQIRLLEARPIGQHATALERAAREERDRAGAVVGALGAVDAGGA